MVIPGNVAGRNRGNVNIDNPAIQTTSVPVILSGAGVDALVSFGQQYQN
jgi:hypothetical protein